MSDGATLELDISGLLRDLQEVPAVMQRRIIKGAVATGCSVVRKAQISLAPEYSGEVSQGHPPPGTLKKAIYQTRLPEKCTDTFEVWKTDVRRGRASRKGKGGKDVAVPDAYYASWVEFGHFTRGPGISAAQHRSARNAGTALLTGARWIPPNSYMRAGFETSQQAALNAMQDYMNDNIANAFAAMRYVRAQS